MRRASSRHVQTVLFPAFHLSLPGELLGLGIASGRSSGDRHRHQPVGLNWFGDVVRAVRTQVFEAQGKVLAGLLEDRTGETDGAQFDQAFQACSDIAPDPEPQTGIL